MSESRHQSLIEVVAADRIIVDYLPEPYMPVLVHCVSHTCMGYVDQKTVWRSRFTDEPLTSRVVGWEIV